MREKIRDRGEFFAGRILGRKFRQDMAINIL